MPSSSLLLGPSLRRWVGSTGFFGGGFDPDQAHGMGRDGNPVTGLKKVGRHEDNLSKLISSGTAKAVQIAYQKFPDAVEAAAKRLTYNLQGERVYEFIYAENGK